MSFDVHAYIGQLSRFGLKPGLHRILGLLRHVGDPHMAFPALHIGGTNGKGSISAVTASILKEAGLKVGLFTSPHLIRYNERIQVDGQPISDAELGALMQKVKEAAGRVASEAETGQHGADHADGTVHGEHTPTEFEVGTAVAFLHFQTKGVDIAVVEVGLGGRLDSTNVLQKTLAVALSPISRDHTSVLGHDLPSIAYEKAGIIKKGRPVVLSPQTPPVQQAIDDEAKRHDAPVIRVAKASATSNDPDQDQSVGKVSQYTPVECRLSGSTFHLDTPWHRFEHLTTPLLGKHQIENAATAVTLALTVAHPVENTAGSVDHGLSISMTEHVVRSGLAKARWPGRLEYRPGSPGYLLDGVHNLGGANVLAEALTDLFRDKRIVFLMGILSEKDAEGMLTTLLPHGSGVVFTQPKSSRIPPIHPEKLSDHAMRLGYQSKWSLDVKDGLSQARSMADADGIVCVCGSLYLVGEVMQFLDK